MIAKVAIENLTYPADGLFDYEVPAQLEGGLRPGCRVVVPFGGGNRRRQGMVMALAEHSELAALKQVQRLVDETPALSEELLGLVGFCKRRWFCTYFDAIKAILPTGSRVRLREYAIPTGKPYSGGDALAQELCALAQSSGRLDLEKLRKERGEQAYSALAGLLQAGVLKRVSDVRRNASDMTRLAAQLAVSHEEADAYVRDCRANAAKHEKVLDILKGCESVPVTELCYLAGVSRSVIDTLARRQIIELHTLELLRRPYREKTRGGDREPICLSAGQRRALDGLWALCESGRPEAALLHGVTGSGKTEVYISLIDRVIARGQNVIVLVPEIALTPQLTDRFYSRYGEQVAVLHSALSIGERYDEWKRLKNGEASIAVGTRSAIFAPLENVGLIVVDEEQEGSYKSENSPRYHARDVAKYRAAKNGALLLLASATPSVESYMSARLGRYHLFTLNERYGGSTLPEVLVADMREDLAKGETSAIGETLAAELRFCLKRGEQAVLFLNRRGYNTFVGCRACGEVRTCPNCSIAMTYHSKNGLLMCHYCGHSEELSDVCPACGSHGMRHLGTGTQRVEEQLAELFPTARVCRMDLDTTSYKSSHEKLLGAFRDGEYDILLGTQMVTKGLDMPNVTLVGVLSADAMLFVEDYRAAERTFMQLTQVVGRAGRADKRGYAVIQTYCPDNRVIELARRQDYEGFFEEEILFRKNMIYPPYCDLYHIMFTGPAEGGVREAARRFHAALADEFRRTGAANIILFAPAPPPIARISQKYRQRILLKCRDDKKLRQTLDKMLINFYNNRENKGVSIYVDVNPNL